MLSELAVRLNCAEYKNWVKAGHCLLLLRSCLQGFIRREVLSFHRGLLATVPGLGPHAICRGGSRCSPRARQVSCWPGRGWDSYSQPFPSYLNLLSFSSRGGAAPRVFLFPLPSTPGSCLMSAPCSFSLSVWCAQSGNVRS